VQAPAYPVDPSSTRALELRPDHRPAEFESWVDELAAPAGESLLDSPGTAGTPDRRRPPEMPLNELCSVSYRGGWIGMLAGENQVQAIQWAIVEINAAGFRVVAAVDDRRNLWKRLGAGLLLILSLGFVGKAQKVLLITERMA
jgi:hypothetical protein